MDKPHTFKWSNMAGKRQSQLKKYWFSFEIGLDFEEFLGAK